MRIDLLSKEGSDAMPLPPKVGAHPSDVPSPVLPRVAIRGDSRKDAMGYQQLLHGFYDAVIVCNAQGLIVDVNVRATEFLKNSREVLCTLSLFDVIYGAERELFETLMRNTEFQQHTLINAYCVRQTGDYFPAEIAVGRLDGDVLCLALFVRDVTARKKAEDMLMAEYSAIINSQGGIAVVNLDGLIDFVNPATEQMWGEKKDELLGKPICGFFVDSDAMANLLDPDAADGGTVQNKDLLSRRSDGGVGPHVQVTVTPYRNSDDQHVGFVLSLIDVSDRIRAQMAEREVEQRRIMQESFGAACHHLGQPATVLTMCLEMMREYFGDGTGRPQELLDQSLGALEEMRDVLVRIQSVDRYLTQPYGRTGSDAAINSEIVKI